MAKAKVGDSADRRRYRLASHSRQPFSRQPHWRSWKELLGRGGEWFLGSGLGFPTPNQDCGNDDSNNPHERQAPTFAGPLHG